MKKLTYEYVKKFIEDKGGILLSEKYINSAQKIKIQCEKGHVWQPTFNDVKKHWCSVCSKRMKHTIKDAQMLAKKYNGLCISDEYINSQEKLIWKCKEGHTFQAKYNDVSQGHWCRECGKEKSKKTYLEKYGVNHPMLLEEVKNKIKQTNLKKYGFEYPQQNKEIALKTAKSSNNSGISYHWKTSEEIVHQGSYERKVIDYLNQNKIDYLWQPQTFQMPNGKTYRPDLCLVGENKWIEIKGYFRKDAQEKWDWFHGAYPNSQLWNEEKLKEMRIL